MAAPILTLPVPDALRYALVTPRDHLRPLVDPGDTVRRGTPIAAGATRLHAASSGRVAAIDLRPSVFPGGRPTPTITIETDGIDAEAPALDTRRDLAALSRDAGIVGLGGGGYPTHMKLAHAAAAGVTTVVVNGADCEPGVDTDTALLEAHAAEILDGARRVQRYLGAARVVVAGERGRLPATLHEVGADVDIVEIDPAYPSGAERILVGRALGVAVAAERFPTDYGIVVFNAATLHALHAAAEHGEPLTRRLVTIEGIGNAWVRIGTPVGAVGLTGDVRAGGPLTGWKVDRTAGLAKTCASLVREPAPRTRFPCIRCGLCADACPVGLLPQELYRLVGAGRSAEAPGLDRCFECGACDRVCPSGLPLLDTYRHGKSVVAETNRRDAAARAALARFEAHRARAERRADAARARRAARLDGTRRWE